MRCQKLRISLLCCGLNSIGIGSGGGVGKVTAEWLMTGHINQDIFSYDIKEISKISFRFRLY